MVQGVEQSLHKAKPASGVSECLLGLHSPSSVTVVLVVGRESLFWFGFLFFFLVYNFLEQGGTISFGEDLSAFASEKGSGIGICGQMSDCGGPYCHF